MSACTDRKELLLLAVYDELDAAGRSELVDHLKICTPCRREMKRLESTLRLVKEKVPYPPLSPREATAMLQGVQRKLIPHHSTRPWERFFSGKRVLWLPAAATAALLILLTTFMGNENLNVQEQTVVQNLDISKRLPENDVEIIKNLDLLKNFNTLEKLSQVVNDSPVEHSIDSNKQGAQGETPYGIKARTV
jgi:anti-sigma factor RsiW